MRIKLNTNLTEPEKINREIAGLPVENKRPACAHWLTIFMRGDNPLLVVGRTRGDVRRQVAKLKAAG